MMKKEQYAIFLRSEMSLKDNELVKKFSDLKCDMEKKKNKFIDENKDLRDYLKNISKISIELARMNLIKDADVNKKNNLIKRLDILINDKYMHDKANRIEYRCPICKDTGFYIGKTCNCFLNLIKENKYEALNEQIPLDDFKFEKFSTDFYSDFQFINGESHKQLMTRNLENCKSYARNFGIHSPGMLFCGPTGLGKTHLVGSIINVLIEKNFDVVYFSAPRLIQEIDNRRFCSDILGDDADSSIMMSSMGSVFESDLLVIDDLGSEFITAFSVSIMYNILNIRTLRKLPVVITTNLDISDLEHKYNDPVISRILGNCLHVKFVGNDIRQKNMSNIMKKKVSDRDVSI